MVTGVESLLPSISLWKQDLTCSKNSIRDYVLVIGDIIVQKQTKICAFMEHFLGGLFEGIYM